MPPLPTGGYSDLHVLDLATMTWTELASSVLGSWPSSRYGHGFTSACGKIYVHGGVEGIGGGDGTGAGVCLFECNYVIFVFLRKHNSMN